MKKKFFIILLILVVISMVAIYAIYQYRTRLAETNKINKEYEQLYNINLLGTQVISLINKTIDLNEKHNIEKNNNGIYIDNGENSIKISINFIYKNGIKTVEMEEIYQNGVEAFIKSYSTASFNCSKISYHEKTKNVKELTLDEVTNQ